MARIWVSLLTESSALFRSTNSSMRAAIYARVSTKDQSCDMQMRDLRAYCAARGFTVIREYIDIGQSGSKDSRPELNELMTDARKGSLTQSWFGASTASPAPLNTSY